jgi:hypothetical protein
MSLTHWNVGITYTLSHTRDLHRNLFVAILPSTYLLPRILTKFTSRIHWNVGITRIYWSISHVIYIEIFLWQSYPLPTYYYLEWFIGMSGLRIH